MAEDSKFSRRSIVTGLGTSAAIGLAGCTGSGNKSGGQQATSESTSTSTTTSAPVKTIDVAGWGGEVESNIVKGILSEYDSNHESVKVDYHNIPFGQYSTKLKTQFSGGTEPEVFYLIAGNAPKYMKNDVLLELGPYVKNNEDYDYDDILDNLLSAFQYDGKTYGIPKDFTPVGLFLNESHLKEAGANTSPKTWAEFRTALETVKQNTSVEYPFAFGSKPRNTLIQLIWQNGGRVLNEDNTKCVVGSTEAIEALQYLIDLRDDGLAGIYGNELSPTWAAPALGKGKVTAAMTGAWSISTWQQKYGSVYDSLKVSNPTPMPSGGQRANIVFTTSWSASARQKTKQSSAELIMDLTSKKGMWEWAKTGSALPARKSLLDNEYYDDHPLLDGLGNLAESGRPFLFGLHHSKVIDTLMSEVQGAITGAKSAEAALKDAERQLNSNVF